MTPEALAHRPGPPAPGCNGDIGRTVNLMHYVTGLEIEAICADLTIFVPAAGWMTTEISRYVYQRSVILTATVPRRSQPRICMGPAAWVSRTISACARTASPSRYTSRATVPPSQCQHPLPAGSPRPLRSHATPELYRVRAKILGIEPGDIMLDFPKVEDGARGVFFIEKAVESSKSDAKWTPAEFKLD